MCNIVHRIRQAKHGDERSPCPWEGSGRVQSKVSLWNHLLCDASMSHRSDTMQKRLSHRTTHENVVIRCLFVILMLFFSSFSSLVSFIFSHIYILGHCCYLIFIISISVIYPLYSSLNPSDYGKYKAFGAEDLYVHAAASS